MDAREFKIYTRTKGGQISVNVIVYALLLTSIGTLFFADKYFDNSIVESIGLWGTLFAGILMLYFKTTQNFTREPLNGSLNRNLIFRENEIFIDDIKYGLTEIEKIDFSVNDYFNKWEYPGRGNLNPARTNGTSNTCEITLTNGQKIKVHFQITQKDDFKQMRELLIKYYSEGKIHFLRLIELLGIDKYEEIQEFKKTLSPTTAIKHYF